MRLIFRREDEDTQRLIRTLRGQITDLTAELAVQSSANGILAASAGRAEAALKGEAANLRAAHGELAAICDDQKDEIERLQREVERLRGEPPAAWLAAQAEDEKESTTT